MSFLNCAVCVCATWPMFRDTCSDRCLVIIVARRAFCGLRFRDLCFVVCDLRCLIYG